MATFFYILGYLAIAGFICMAFLKIRSYLAASPLHVRWELYPVPHEGDKSSYGGSFMEEKEWWTKPRHVEEVGAIKAMLMEALFLHATFEHNQKLWLRTYPFHFGMYMLMGGTIIVLFAAIAQLLGASQYGACMIFVENVINAVTMVGGLAITGGAIALILRRKNDAGLRRYTTPEHYFNLLIFAAFAILGLLAWISASSYFELAITFITNLLTANFVAPENFFFTLHLLLGFFLLIWIPMTQMGHLFMKYFTYHDIRWGDVPTVYSERNKEIIPNALKNFSVNWSADHVTGGAGSKTWLDVATSNPAAPKNEN